jgi:stage V sporulation protein G
MVTGMMAITQVRIYPFDTAGLGGRTLAYADITIDACLMIKGLRVMEGDGGGLFVAYPAQRGRHGRFHELIVPIDAATRELIRAAVIDAYRHSLGNDSGRG